MENKYVLEIKTVQIAPFRTLMTALKDILLETNITFQPDGIKIINHLIDEAIKLRVKRISIETGAGKFFEPARKLFNKCSFVPCEPFAHYKEDINSIYLTKLINNN